MANVGIAQQGIAALQYQLVVDDNQTNRLILRRWMEALGCRHAEAASGEQSLDMLRQACAQGDPYHLALLDMRMPGLSGLEVARTVHDDATIHDLPLLLLTSEWDRDWVKDEDRAFTGVLPMYVYHVPTSPWPVKPTPAPGSLTAKRSSGASSPYPAPNPN